MVAEQSLPFSEDVRLVVRPLQVVELGDGVVLSRGQRRVRLAGSGAYEAVESLLRALQPPGTSFAQIAGRFAAPDRSRLRKLVALLAARDLVVEASAVPAEPASEAAEDIFFWDFGLHAPEVRAAFGRQRVQILGVNLISAALSAALSECGFPEPGVVDVPTLRNLREFGDPGSPEEQRRFRDPPAAERQWRRAFDGGDRPALLVAASDFGGKAMLRPWNEICVTSGTPFMPVVLQDMVGSIGPYVVPGETPCYECVRARENANMDEPLVQRTLETGAFEGQFACGYHPVLPQIVAGIAAFEITKILAGLGGGPIGRIVSFSALDSHMTSHRVLRLPHCPVCGSDARHAGVALGDIDNGA